MPSTRTRLAVVTPTARRSSPLDEVIRSFARSLEASNLSERTIETYTDSAQQFAQFRLMRIGLASTSNALAIKSLPESASPLCSLTRTSIAVNASMMACG